jgi:LPXTG-motif cell wall-anchored protein
MQISASGRRTVIVAFVVTLALAATATSAASAPDHGAAGTATTWLASELVDGTYENPLTAAPDYGLTIDAMFAMHAAASPGLAGPIVAALDDDAQAINYFSYAGFMGDAGKDDRVADATAKTLVAALVSGRDPRNFGGYDMVAETEATITPAGAEQGRVRDFGPNVTINNSNTFGQSLAVIGLAGVRQNNQSVIHQLLRQQCSEGYFRIVYAYNPDPPNAPNDCDGGKAYDQSAPDGDSTGIALSALLAAQRSGAGGLDDAIARARAWLVADQDADGGWGGGTVTQAPNTNSTGLIVQALADAGGAESAVNRGRDYVLRAQVTAARDAANDLRNDLGAIAYTPAEYVAARSGGIGARDTWTRATAQASLALSQVGFWALVTQQVPATTTSTTTATPVTTAGVSGPGTTGNTGNTVGGTSAAGAETLPNTGTSTGGLLALAGVLLVAGAGLVTNGRRARPNEGGRT